MAREYPRDLKDKPVETLVAMQLNSPESFAGSTLVIRKWLPSWNLLVVFFTVSSLRVQ